MRRPPSEANPVTFSGRLIRMRDSQGLSLSNPSIMIASQQVDGPASRPTTWPSGKLKPNTSPLWYLAVGESAPSACWFRAARSRFEAGGLRHAARLLARIPAAMSTQNLASSSTYLCGLLESTGSMFCGSWSTFSSLRMHLRSLIAICLQDRL
jgi:hypothetical protein